MVPGYREVRQLGAGRTGRVFLATYQPTGAYVAIKYLNATLRRDAEFMDRFRADTPHLVEIEDPNVVRLYEYVETPARAAVVMELVDGVPLRTLLAEHGPIAPEAALAVLKSTLLALAAAHERGVPHRDVTPGNLLVQADGGTKLGDFGVVVHAEEPGVPAGTPPYMAPELWTLGRAGPPADLYAAACVLFEAVRGRPPYVAPKDGGAGSPRPLGQDSGAASEVLVSRSKHLEEPVPLEVVPDALRDLLRRGLAKDPSDRYASARQFAAALEQDAAAGYGPDWEKRGRRHLAEQATLLALRFPLARTDSRTSLTTGLRERVPRLPPQLWVAGATVVAALIAILLSGGHLPEGPGTILMPPPRAQTETRTEAGTETRSSQPPTPATRAPSPPATTPPPATAAPPLPTPQGGSSVPLPAVRAAGISGWNGTTGSITVTVDGTGPVRLLIAYTRRDGDGGAARTLRREARTLRGRTSYTSAVAYSPGEVGCGEQAHLGLLVMTEPAAANGPQVSEATLNGPACPPAPTPRSPVPTPEPSASPTTTPEPPSSNAPIAPPPTSNAPAIGRSEAPAIRSSGAPAARPSDTPVVQLSGGPSVASSSSPEELPAAPLLAPKPSATR
ncbi:protein kinase domain-containing protein [[Actinomadura] parvosata]|uniref:protein kinase domain-containing protein n=1 Tax=[Actinomadura] parvosata TaxID=1955412 RepID=UPI00406C8FD9